MYDEEEGIESMTQEMVDQSVDERLQQLLLSIFTSSLSSWREASRESTVSLPTLESFDWRVDLKTANDSISQMSIPSLLLHLQVSTPPSSSIQSPSSSSSSSSSSSNKSSSSSSSGVDMELSQEALEAMLEGLGRIKDQLTSVADSNQT